MRLRGYLYHVGAILIPAKRALLVVEMDGDIKHCSYYMETLLAYVPQQSPYSLKAIISAGNWPIEILIPRRHVNLTNEISACSALHTGSGLFWRVTPVATPVKSNSCIHISFKGRIRRRREHHI